VKGPYRCAERWLLADGLFDAVLRELSIDGLRHREGVAFFLGHHVGPEAHVTHLIALRGERLVKREDHLCIPAALMNEVTDHAIAQAGVLLGQVHSHGPGYGVDLSYPDHYFGIRAPGFLSLVCPDFGLHSETCLEDCGVHVFDAPRGFRRMRTGEIRQRFGSLLGTPPQTLIATL
jgi:hypothetical protein